MQNAASKNRAPEIAFVADAPILRRLAVVLREISEVVEYSVKFSDGTSVTYTDIEEVIEQPNSGPRSIVSVVAVATDGGIQAGYVVLRKNAAPYVEYTVNGPQRNVIYFSDQLDVWLSGLRQWYSPALSSAGGVVLLFIAFLLPLYLVDHAPHSFLGLAKSHRWIRGVSIVLMWVVECFIFQLFPRGTFAIGYGAKRHQLLVSIRNGIFVIFVLSVTASVVANWITRQF
jgi:hypothetical protein